MKSNNVIKFSLVLCLVGLASTQALAYEEIATAWSANYPDSCQELQNASESCVLCHTVDFARNDYAKDLKDADYVFAAIEDMDSDGDGRTNGEEILLDCSLPGDAVSPADTDTWGNIKALFR